MLDGSYPEKQHQNEILKNAFAASEKLVLRQPWGREKQTSESEPDGNFVSLLKKNEDNSHYGTGKGKILRVLKSAYYHNFKATHQSSEDGSYAYHKILGYDITRGDFHGFQRDVQISYQQKAQKQAVNGFILLILNSIIPAIYPVAALLVFSGVYGNGTTLADLTNIKYGNVPYMPDAWAYIANASIYTIIYLFIMIYGWCFRDDPLLFMTPRIHTAYIYVIGVFCAAVSLFELQNDPTDVTNPIVGTVFSGVATLCFFLCQALSRPASVKERVHFVGVLNRNKQVVEYRNMIDKTPDPLGKKIDQRRILKLHPEIQDKVEELWESQESADRDSTVAKTKKPKKIKKKDLSAFSMLTEQEEEDDERKGLLSAEEPQKEEEMGNKPSDQQFPEKKTRVSFHSVPQEFKPVTLWSKLIVQGGIGWMLGWEFSNFFFWICVLIEPNMLVAVTYAIDNNCVAYNTTCGPGAPKPQLFQAALVMSYVSMILPIVSSLAFSDSMSLLAVLMFTVGIQTRAVSQGDSSLSYAIIGTDIACFVIWAISISMWATLLGDRASNRASAGNVISGSTSLSTQRSQGEHFKKVK